MCLVLSKHRRLTPLRSCATEGRALGHFANGKHRALRDDLMELGKQAESAPLREPNLRVGMEHATRVP